MSYDIRKQIEDAVTNIISEGCHIHKTNNNIAVYTNCSEEKMKQHQNEIDTVLAPYRKQYKIYTMTESYYKSFYK